MNFLAQPILWGLFAAAIPVIIHLLNRRRFRTVQWAAMTFLLKASRESRGKKKLKHILILTCRALAIAALIFAVARPLVGGLLGSGSGKAGTILLVLDRSASMELKTADGEPSQRQSVIDKMAEAVTNLGSPRLLLLDSASGKVQEVASPDALPELSSTFATDTEADIPTLLANAIDYLQETKPGSTEIWLASDMQRENWRPSDSRWNAVTAGLKALPEEPQTVIITADTKEVENFSLELIASRRIENDLLLDLRLIRRGGDGPATIPITYSLKGARSSERVTIEGQELRFQKQIPLTIADDSGYGWVGLPADNNTRDNSVFFAFGGKEPVKSWVVAEKPSSDIAEYLQAAAAPAGLDLFSAEIVGITQTAAIDWSTASLIVWQAPLPTGAMVTQLTEFVNSGGSLVFFPPEGETTESIFGISWGEIELAPAEQFFINGPWRKDDGPWRDSLAGESMPVDLLRGLKRRSIQGDLSTFAEWDDNSPLMGRQIEGLGTAVFIATLPDDRWSNLENTGLHIAAIQRMAQKGNDRLHAGYRAYAGTERTETRGDEVRERLDSYEEFEPVLGGYRTGVYRMGDRILAVNRPPSENSPDRLDDETREELLKDISYSMFSNDNSKSKLVSEAWRAFLIAVLLFLLAEALLCLQPKRTGPNLPAAAAARTKSAPPTSAASSTAS